MSHNPNIQRATWFQQAPEVLLEILSKMDQSSRIEIAIAYPEVFLRPGFNIFLQDAEDQVRRHNRQDPAIPLFITRNTRPLLYPAIDRDMNISVIENMLRVYTNYCPSSIDGIWGQSPSTLPPPLIHAVSLGRSQIVSLLLNLGANPRLRCGPHNYRLAIPADCSLSAFSHEQCQPVNPATQPNATGCITPLAVALFKGIDLRSHDSEHRALEDCALILYNAGAPLPTGGTQFNPAIDSDLEQQIYYPIRAGFCNLVRAILDPLIPLRQGQIGFRTILYYGLTCAINFQKSDDIRDIIEYLVGIDSFLIHPGHQLPYHGNTHAHLASTLGHYKTATFLLDRYIGQGVPLDFESFELLRSGDLTPFVQTLYRAMNGGGFIGTRAASTNDLHEYLLSKVIRSKDDASVQWLVDQKAGTSINVHYAIIQGNISALRALILAGLPINTITNISMDTALRLGFYTTFSASGMFMETPLNLALRLKRWEMACLLIHHGADPSLISDPVKNDLPRDFSARYNMPIADGKQKITPAMLQREYFATIDSDRIFAMFYYVLG
ncbi:hypothetical protein F4859DRAFT_525206 [Xylaria cf. heliscus]|nr:hypothetical protein F4859DRAFT_525206 [Xylaria cf. heliscus]